jgi:hypothetical protein
MRIRKEEAARTGTRLPAMPRCLGSVTLAPTSLYTLQPTPPPSTSITISTRKPRRGALLPAQRNTSRLWGGTRSVPFET